MVGHALTRRALAALSQRAARREFPVLVGLFAFLVTVTLTLPVEVLGVLGTLMCRQSWLRISCSAALASCLVPGFDGALFSLEWKDALWAKFCMGAPARRRQCVARSSIVKRA